MTTASGNQRVILINNAGSGYTVNNNIIGYSSVDATGMYVNSGGTFTGIYMSTGASPVSNVQGNTINNVNWTSATASSTGGSATFNGIVVMAGAVNVGSTTGNTIGASTGTASPTSGIYLTTSVTGCGIIPIYLTSTSNCSIQNNVIGAISANAAIAAIGFTFNGVQVAGTGSHTITSNTIGTTTAGSIAIGVTGTTTTACNITGIFSSGTGSVNIGSSGAGNIIQNLNNNSSGTGYIYGFIIHSLLRG